MAPVLAIDRSKAVIPFAPPAQTQALAKLTEINDGTVVAIIEEQGLRQFVNTVTLLNTDPNPTNTKRLTMKQGL